VDDDDDEIEEMSGDETGSEEELSGESVDEEEVEDDDEADSAEEADADEGSEEDDVSESEEEDADGDDGGKAFDFNGLSEIIAEEGNNNRAVINAPHPNPRNEDNDEYNQDSSDEEVSRLQTVFYTVKKGSSDATQW
jgi:hypothetical protein